MRRGVFPTSTLSWYVDLASGKQVWRGRDDRFQSAPMEKPEEPPPFVQKDYLADPDWHGESEDRTLRLGCPVVVLRGTLKWT